MFIYNYIFRGKQIIQIYKPDQNLPTSEQDKKTLEGKTNT